MDDASLPGLPAAGELARMNRLATIARLLAGLTHDLNNSLQIIGGTIELLADRSDLPEDVAKNLQRIGGQAEKATLAIRQVMAYSREVASGTSMVDLAGVVRQALALRHYPLSRAGVAVKTEGLDGPEIRVRADERTLTQAILNLIINGEEALAGQASRQLRVGLDLNGTVARLRVSDSGPGVPQDVRGRIFGPFFTTRSNDRAVGLGLAVSREIVERTGGRLTLADAASGATFVIELPLA
jgi:signal transduction histidine kinase